MQSVLSNGLVQPPVPKVGLGRLCRFLVSNVSPHPTGKSEAFQLFQSFFIGILLGYCCYLLEFSAWNTAVQAGVARATVHCK